MPTHQYLQMLKYLNHGFGSIILFVSRIQIRGKIIAPIASIGGETSDFVLEESESAKRYDLVLSLKDREEIAKYGNEEIEVEGDSITLPGVEKGDRPGIIVKKFHAADSLL